MAISNKATIDGGASTSVQQLAASASQTAATPAPVNYNQPATIQSPDPVVTKSDTTPDPMHDKSVMPTAPKGQKYMWIGGATTGQWQLYSDGSGGGGVTGGATPHGKVTGTQTIEKNGRQVIVTTFEDGTTSEQDYGVSAATQAQQQNWLTVGKNLLEQYGVGSLWNDYQDLILNKGYDSATAMLAMQSLPSWTNRFSANKARLAQGLPVLDPATYLATEEKYKDVMISAGIDKSVYNDPTKLGDLMAKDVSPYEMQQRIDAARYELDNKDPYVLDQLKMRFGLTEGDIVLHMLDPQLASSVVAQKVASAKIGAEAARQGLGSNFGISEADRLAASGVTQAQAASGFLNIGQEQQFTQALPGDTSGSVTNQQLANAQFGLSAEDTLATKAVQAKRISEYQQGGAFAATAAGAGGLGSANAAS